MTEHDATEAAYKRGYEDGLRDGNPKKGKWVDYYPGDEHGYRCSNCKIFFFANENFLKKAHFCLNCGADMRRRITMTFVCFILGAWLGSVATIMIIGICKAARFDEEEERR